jgi:CheY-like chemotaxis protein
MLGILVSSLGHITQLACDGRSALDVDDTFVPDVIVLDIGLPIMNGYAVAQELRRRPAMHHVHIAALTAWGQSEDRPRAREAGFDTHFTKPVSATAVKEKICCRRWLWVSNMPATPTAGHAPGPATDRSCHDDRCPTKRDRDLNL